MSDKVDQETPQGHRDVGTIGFCPSLELNLAIANTNNDISEKEERSFGSDIAREDNLGQNQAAVNNAELYQSPSGNRQRR